MGWHQTLNPVWQMSAVAKTSLNEQLFMLTQEMLSSAQAGDWEKLTKLEKKRLPILAQVFADGIAGNVELARNVLSKAEMPIIQNELQKMKNSGKASAAYQAIQGFSSSYK